MICKNCYKMKLFKLIFVLDNKLNGLNKLKLIIIYILLIPIMLGYLIKRIYGCEGLQNEKRKRK